jgi:hypothetical protein
MTRDDATPASFLIVRAYRKEPAVASSDANSLGLLLVHQNGQRLETPQILMLS